MQLGEGNKQHRAVLPMSAKPAIRAAPAMPAGDHPAPYGTGMYSKSPVSTI